MHCSSTDSKSLFEHLRSGAGLFSGYEKIGVYYESECSLVILNMLLTAHCITRHVIWKLGSLIFTLDFFFFFNLSFKVVPFNLDMTILYRKLSFLYLLTWQCSTLLLNKTRKGNSDPASSNIPTETSHSLSLCASHLACHASKEIMRRDVFSRELFTFRSICGHVRGPGNRSLLSSVKKMFLLQL